MAKVKRATREQLLHAAQRAARMLEESIAETTKWKDATASMESQALEACDQNANLRKHAHDIHLAIGALQDAEQSYEHAKTQLAVAREVLATLDDRIGEPVPLGGLRITTPEEAFRRGR